MTHILQFDPPTNPDFFIHRAGRTGRMGKSGISILFLSKNEEEYIQFLQIKKVPISELHSTNAATTTTNNNNNNDETNALISGYFEIVKEQMKKDRELFEKAEMAFASYCRGYKEHQCNYIFKLEKLNVDDLAQSFCLLRHPTKKIFRYHHINFKFLEDFSVDFDNIPYLDEKKEATRLQKIEKKKLQMLEKQTINNEEKINGEVLMDEDEDDKNPVRKEKGLYEKKMSIRRQTLTHKKRKRAMEFLEDDELEKDALYLRKLKKGKITEKDYERLTGEVYYNLKDDLDIDDSSGIKRKRRHRHKKKK